MRHRAAKAVYPRPNTTMGDAFAIGEAAVVAALDLTPGEFDALSLKTAVSGDDVRAVVQALRSVIAVQGAD
jgi:hypothetical protein